MIESKDNKGRARKCQPPIDTHGMLGRIIFVAAARDAAQPDGLKPTYVCLHAELMPGGLPVICPLYSREIVDKVIAGLTACRDEVWPEEPQ